MKHKVFRNLLLIGLSIDPCFINTTKKSINQFKKQDNDKYIIAFNRRAK
jgi:hypothetical protein